MEPPPAPTGTKPAKTGDEPDSHGEQLEEDAESRWKLLADQKEEIDRQRRVEEEQEQLRLLAERREQAEKQVEKLRADRRRKGEDAGHQRGAAAFQALQGGTQENVFDKLKPPPDATQEIFTQRDRAEQSRSPPPARGGRGHKTAGAA